MPLQNRVSPLGELLAVPERGLVYGNRGCLHDNARQIRRAYNGRRWIACRLAFRGRRRGPMMQRGRYTELFFLDEATALAAGHRPCAECRWPDYRRLLELHPMAGGADGLDERLHAERVYPGRFHRRLHEVPIDQLPDGAFIVRGGAPWMVLGDRLRQWTPAGYAGSQSRPGGGTAQLVTPPLLLPLLADGCPRLVPFLHPSA
ncbi:MAG TPA: hypothetical protein VFQ71_14825 [Gaiellales bacterium]|jgi:hypothetical protein|nr:hypothetical protein [Gaiellales bacterium]